MPCMVDDPAAVAAQSLVEVVPRLARLIAGALESGSEPALSLRQYRLLERLADGPHRTTELALNAHVSQPTASAALASLEANGLVVREPDPADRRATLIALTEEGRAVHARARQLVLERLMLVTGDVTPRHARALQELQPVLSAGVDRARDALRPSRPAASRGPQH